MEVFLRVSFHWDFLHLTNGLVSTDFQCTARFGNLVSNVFLVLYKLHHSNLLNQLESLFQLWPERVVAFRFNLFQKDHPQIGFMPRIFL